MTSQTAGDGILHKTSISFLMVNQEKESTSQYLEHIQHWIHSHWDDQIQRQL